MRQAFKFILVISLLFALSCQKDMDAPSSTNFDNSFYPLAVGSWISYQVESINIDSEISVNDTNRYQIKEVIESIGEQTNECNNYRIERYFRNTSDDDWVLSDVWQVRQYARRIHKVEENIEYYRLITPVKEGAFWNGNAFNTSDEQEYEITELTDTTFLTQNRKKAQVLQADQSSLIDKVYASEIYIESIGLVYKSDINVELNIDPEPDWQEKVIKGTIYTQSYLNSSHSTLQ